MNLNDIFVDILKINFNIHIVNSYISVIYILIRIAIYKLPNNRSG